MSSELVYVALGANLGDPIDTLLNAVDELRPLALKSDIELSSFYRTKPIDAQGPDYINAVACFKTSLEPLALLHQLQAIEQRHGRIRGEKNAPRSLDLDLLLYGAERLNTPELCLPHPRMHMRAFVLRPLADLAPDMVLEQGSIAQLLENVLDQEIHALGEPDDD